MTLIFSILTSFTVTLALEEPIVLINPYDYANSQFVQQSKLARHLLDTDYSRTNTLSTEAKQAILDAHNEYRSSVALGNTDNQPRATDMNSLLWDEGLAQTAQYYAEQCYFAPNSGSEMHYQGQAAANTEIITGPLGENLYFTSQNEIPDDELTATLVDAVTTWYNQNEYYQDGECEAEEVTLTENCRYYQQLVSAQTRYVGCAYNQCDEGLSFYNNENFNDGANVIVCYYFEDNNLDEAPYTTTENDEDIATECVDSIGNYNGLCLACYPDTVCQDGLGRNALNFDDADNNNVDTQHPTSNPTPEPTPEPTQVPTSNPPTASPTPQPTEASTSTTTQSPTVTPRECGDWTSGLRYTAGTSRDETATRARQCCTLCVEDNECVGASFFRRTNTCTLFTEITASDEDSGRWQSMMIL